MSFAASLVSHLHIGAIARAPVRLYVPQPLFAAAAIALPDGQRHYLASVMRAKEGGHVALFNGDDGEWTARIDTLDRKRCHVVVDALRRPQPMAAPAPTLLFGVLKGARLPTLIEKATELGVGELVPVLTARCAARDLNIPRMQAIAVEAAEQCGRLTVPPVRPVLPLARALDGWDPSRPLFACDTRGAEDTPALAGLAVPARGGGLLIGPEGGLAPEEIEAIEALECTRLVTLGPNTLRAETAALAALALVCCSS